MPQPDKEVLCTTRADTHHPTSSMQGVSAGFFLVFFNTDGEIVWDNVGPCNSKVALEGCSSRVARLGPHPHAPSKGFGGFGSVAQQLFQSVPTRVSLFRASYTPPDAKAAPQVNQTCPICSSWRLRYRARGWGGPCWVYTVWPTCRFPLQNYKRCSPPPTLPDHRGF